MKGHPLLYEINTAVVLRERARALGRQATLDDLPDHLLDAVAEAGFDWLWPLGVWDTGDAAREVARTHVGIRGGLQRAIADLSDGDVQASPFAIRAYAVRREWGGDAALTRLRRRLADRGVRLMLDFVVNHVALDHPWVDEHPEYFVAGSPEDLAREPGNYAELRREPRRIFANGRDPYFEGWPDTLQLNLWHRGLREALITDLLRVARAGDGIRCDMAMLAQPDVFERTWGERARPSDGSEPARERFWTGALKAVRRELPEQIFLAEVYWDREWELQREGFDFTYDKRLYDRLRGASGRAVREHLLGDLDFQARSARFLENHGEARAATTFPLDVHRAAAVLTYLSPGMRFFHEGQIDGRRVRVPVHVDRRPDEAPDQEVRGLYGRILHCMRRPEVHEGQWRLWACRAAYEGNTTWEDMIVMSWVQGERRVLVAVNYAPRAGQCYVSLDMPGLSGSSFDLLDLMSDVRYERQGDVMRTTGLYLDMAPWQAQVFELRRR